MRAIYFSLSADLLNPYWRSKAAGEHRTFGHCYVATEALWHLLGGKRSGYQPYVISLPENETHWFLQHKDSGRRLDVTKAQFGKDPIPYEQARCTGFLTVHPSRRARIVMTRAREWLRANSQRSSEA
jgi:hypothetical protein